MKEIEKYSFNASQGNNEHRFNLHLTKASTIGLDENEELTGVNVYAHDHNIYFNADENLSNATMTVYNTIGQVVLTTKVESGSEIIRMETRGAYIVRLQSNEGNMTEKVIIK
ncbi:MAG: T9SS type A sorting domain-containing protein [Bacteroidales bacterium]|nr:T9SS type A sorting domain-containing protein [Bacteroidales bacterium]